MRKEYTAVIMRDGKWWIGWVEEIPGVNCQERSRKELMESLKATLHEALRFNKKEALSAAKRGYMVEKIAV